jgi:hypothetical protein
MIFFPHCKFSYFRWQCPFSQDLVNDLQIEPGMSDHEIVIANINIGAQRQHRSERTVYQCKKGNMNDMRMDMKEFSDKFCEQDHRTKDTGHCHRK